MKKPKIALVVPDTIEKPTGGLGVHAQALYRYLKDDFDFSIHAFPEDNSIPNYHGVKNPYLNMAHPSLKTLIAQHAYTESIIESDPDIIHVTDYTLIQGALVASHILKKPLIITFQLSSFFLKQFGIVHGFDLTKPDGASLQQAFELIELKGLEEADQIIHVSQSYKEGFKQLGDFDNKSNYIPNGIDLEDWNEKEKIKLPGKRKKKVVFLGRFAPQKNTIELINAKIPEDVDLIFYGLTEGCNQETLKSIEELVKNKEGVYIEKPVYGQEKINTLYSADAVILPSLHECHPIIMHEALISESIFIATDAGDVPFVIPETIRIKSGYERNNISEALQKFSDLDEKEIKQRIKDGLELVQNYTWEKTAKGVAEVYKKVLSTQ